MIEDRKVVSKSIEKISNDFGINLKEVWEWKTWLSEYFWDDDPWMY